MLKTIESSSPPIDGILLFDLFSIRHSEPFIVMYGFSAAWSCRPEPWQMKQVQSSMYRKATFERWREIGLECKEGKRQMPEWVKDVRVQR